MKSYPEVQEVIARALCDGNPDRVPFGETQSAWPIWMDHKKEAANVIAQLVDAGLILFSPTSWQSK
jgi:hypothetical protein